MTTRMYERKLGDTCRSVSLLVNPRDLEPLAHEIHVDEVPIGFVEMCGTRHERPVRLVITGLRSDWHIDVPLGSKCSLGTVMDTVTQLLTFIFATDTIENPL